MEPDTLCMGPESITAPLIVCHGRSFQIWINATPFTSRLCFCSASKPYTLGIRLRLRGMTQRRFVFCQRRHVQNYSDPLGINPVGSSRRIDLIRWLLVRFPGFGEISFFLFANFVAILEFWGFNFGFQCLNFLKALGVILGFQCHDS